MFATAGQINILEEVVKKLLQKTPAWREKHNGTSLCMELGDLEPPLVD